MATTWTHTTTTASTSTTIPWSLGWISSSEQHTQRHPWLNARMLTIGSDCISIGSGAGRAGLPRRIAVDGHLSPQCGTLHYTTRGRRIDEQAVNANDGRTTSSSFCRPPTSKVQTWIGATAVFGFLMLHMRIGQVWRAHSLNLLNDAQWQHL